MNLISMWIRLFTLIKNRINHNAVNPIKPVGGYPPWIFNLDSPYAMAMYAILKTHII